MPSRLTLPATEFERRRNLLRNLPPYRKPGAFTPMGSPGVIETELNDYQVVDSPEFPIYNQKVMLVLMVLSPHLQQRYKITQRPLLVRRILKTLIVLQVVHTIIMKLLI